MTTAQIIAKRYESLTPDVKTPYTIPNFVTSRENQVHNQLNSIGYQGFTFNIPNGASTQTLQLPGDCSLLLGVMGSWDNSTFPGFNNTITLTVNNQNILSATNVALLNINRFLVQPGYVVLNKYVSPTSLLNVALNNGTGVTLTNFNLIVAYK
jgi:hypothetical protein